MTTETAKKGKVDGMITSEVPWSEKYRPKSLDEVAAHKDIINTSTYYRIAHGYMDVRYTPASMVSALIYDSILPIFAVKKLLDENQLPHLLFYGPPGTGKTSTIIALAREIYGNSISNMALELNASDDRGIDIVRHEIQDFASTRTIFSNKFKLVILDECDAMTKDAQMALRRVMEKYVKNARFCLICNYVSKIIPALQSRCTRFRFQPIPEQFVRTRLQYICDEEHVPVETSGLDALIQLGEGDMRRTLNLLQSTRMAAGKATEEAVYACAGKPLPADIEACAQWLLNEPLQSAFQSTSRGCCIVQIIAHKKSFGLTFIVLYIYAWYRVLYLS